MQKVCKIEQYIMNMRRCVCVTRFRIFTPGTFFMRIQRLSHGQKKQLKKEKGEKKLFKEENKEDGCGDDE